MVVAEVLTGIALVQQSVKFIKDNINTAKDIGDIAGQIDDLFRGEKEVQQLRNKKAGSVSLGDQFGVNSVAKEVIDSKIAAEKMQEIRTLVDLRFGPGTWQGILDERAKRIQEAKEAAAKARKQAMEERQEMLDALKLAGVIGIVVAISVGLFIFLAMSVQAEPS
jgi:Fe2+ transport system protein B